MATYTTIVCQEIAILAGAGNGTTWCCVQRHQVVWHEIDILHDVDFACRQSESCSRHRGDTVSYHTRARPLCCFQVSTWQASCNEGMRSANESGNNIRRARSKRSTHCARPFLFARLTYRPHVVAGIWARSTMNNPCVQLCRVVNLRLKRPRLAVLIELHQ